jgi:hypothetical protein
MSVHTVKKVHASYNQVASYDVSHLKLDYNDIAYHWCKYGTLMIEMVDGTTHEVSDSHLYDIDWKYPENLEFFNKKGYPLTEDEDGNG